MDRRQFLHCCAAAGVAATVGAPATASANEVKAGMSDLLIADPHAHPYQLFGSRTFDRSTPTIEIMQQINMALCAFSAVGDMAYMRGRFGTPFTDTLGQLGQVKRLEEKGQIRLVLKAADLPSLQAPRQTIGGLMAIEGGDALEGQLKNLDSFHDYGVRLMTLMHERDNELGFNQRSSSDGPLTAFGIQVVERMNQLGMVVDVAHASPTTLKAIAVVSALPLVDSHTSPILPDEERQPSRRLRTWQEMELIARSGGMVCTWPFAYAGKNSERTTLRHWAEEIVQMKSRLGIEHCGLGTDGSGGLPRFIKGWNSIADLPALIATMREAGLSQADIAAYVGGNFLRVLEKCLA
jgi:microsomal dipeptidase-like Zn-dependent dipeptidase